MAKNGKIKRIYADTAAGIPEKSGKFVLANPSSLHEEGVLARQAIEQARAKVAELIGAHADEIIFTSGGTEANNLAIFGTVQSSALHKNHEHEAQPRGAGNEIVTTSIEHSSVLEPAKALASLGNLVSKSFGHPVSKLVVVRVGERGIVDPEEIKKVLTDKTKLVSVIYANNEIGTIQPIREISKMLRNFRKHEALNTKLETNSKRLEIRNLKLDIDEKAPLFHIDACQAPRFLDINVARLGVDMMTLNSSKIYGPKGAGCLYVKRGIKLTPLIFGGGQERGLRAGTENVSAIVGFAKALALCAKLHEKESAKLTKLRDELIIGLLKVSVGYASVNFNPASGLGVVGNANNTGAKLNGDLMNRLPNNVNVLLPVLEPEQWVLELDAKGIACSAGSACSSNFDHLADKQNDSHDIMGVRFSLGREITKAEINYIIKSVSLILKKYARDPIS